MNKDLQTMDTTVDRETTYQDFDLWKANLEKQEAATLVSMETLSKAQKEITDKLLKQKLADIEKEHTSKKVRDAKIAELKANWYKEELRIASKMEDNLYKYSSLKAKAKITEQKKLTAQKYAEELKLELATLEASDAAEKDKKSKRQKINDLQREANKDAIKYTQDQMKLEEAMTARTSKERAEKLSNIQRLREEERDRHKERLEELDIQIAAAKEEAEAAANDPDNPNAGSKAMEKVAQLEEEKAEAEKDSKKSENANFVKELKAGIKKGMEDGVGKSIDAMVNAIGGAVDKAIDSVGQYKSAVDARLQGTQSSYNEVAKTLKGALAVSPFVKQTEVLQKLNDAVNKGIAYNVEQRAFLATMTDKIVATFDAFDSNLMRIIRLQQADTTVARMGMEAQLLQFFNSTFSDNSYLVEGYDSVSQALIDANAQMTREMSIAFEYNVQKWLGSLASLGFGTDTITRIATGINYLGSGNVQALAGDSELMNLMAMSASRSGYSLSDLLVQGIDDNSANELLKSMVEYLAEIADSNNAVVKAAYGDVFNFTQSDLRAITNLTEDDISNIYAQAMDYSKAIAETQNQLNAVGGRMSMTEMINNVFDNFLYTAGESIGSNPATAILWKTLSVLDTVTGGDLKIPEVMAAGFGVNITSSIPNLLKTGIFGLSAIGNIGNMITSMANGGGMDLGIWKASDYTARGGNFQSNVGGVQKTTSGSKSVVTNSSSSDSKKSAIDSTSEDQEESKKRSKELSKDEITLETMYKEIFEKKSVIHVKDVPILNKMDAIATAVASVNTSTQSISNKIHTEGNAIKVNVTNFDGLIAAIVSPAPTKIDDTSVTAIATQIISKLDGNDKFTAIANNTDTISKNKSFDVSDSVTHDLLTGLQSAMNQQ